MEHTEPTPAGTGVPLSSTLGSCTKEPQPSEKSLKSLLPPCLLLAAPIQQRKTWIAFPRSFERCLLLFGFFFPSFLLSFSNSRKKRESRGSRAGFSAICVTSLGLQPLSAPELGASCRGTGIPWGSSRDHWHCQGSVTGPGYRSRWTRLHGKLPVLFLAGLIP